MRNQLLTLFSFRFALTWASGKTPLIVPALIVTPTLVTAKLTITGLTATIEPESQLRVSPALAVTLPTNIETSVQVLLSKPGSILKGTNGTAPASAEVFLIGNHPPWSIITAACRLSRSCLLNRNAGIVIATGVLLIEDKLLAPIQHTTVASVASRFAAVTLGAYGVWHFHNLVTKPQWFAFCADVTPNSRIAVLAILANIATPIGNAYVTAILVEFGDSAVAGWAVIGRIIPVAFGAIFALSGAVGPILGQNLGAKRYDRVRQALSDALLSMTVYVALVWGALALLHPGISAAFNASLQAAELIRVFCLWLAPLFGFFGALYVANAAFNNLGHYSTLFNWGRATLGNIPLVYMGSKLFGPIGVIAANMISAVIFGTLAAIVCYRLIVHLAKDTEPPFHGWALWRQPNMAMAFCALAKPLTNWQVKP